MIVSQVSPQRENERKTLQVKLDAAKTAVERNELGQFSTPTPLALDILGYACDLLPSDQTIRFLDPAIGTGSFFSALLETFPSARIGSAIGYEIDPHYGEPATELWSSTPLELRLADFTTALPPDESVRANLLICNPPYVRHHHLQAEEKWRLQGLTFNSSGMRLSGLAGLYCHFLGLSHVWLTDGGLAGWLIPSEFMDVNYGQEVKRYLLDKVTLLHVHRFDPHDAQFDDALVSSAVVWFHKTPPSSHHEVAFSYGGTLQRPQTTMTVTREELRRIPKWSRLPAVSAEQACGHTGRRLADLFKIRRGLATGGNDFFILNPDQIAQHQLPKEFLRPILPSPRYLTADEVSADALGNPILERPLYLLDCRLPELEVQERYSALWTYLQSGVERGVDQGYLSQHREPWYAQEQRSAAPLVCTYMGRQRTKSGRPFRFILNHSQATAANVYLMLYPTPLLAQRLLQQPELLRVVWQWLNAIEPATLLAEGRVYGGGLHKLEPKELANMPVDSLIAQLEIDVHTWEQPALAF